jgi:hypothetical protein
MSKITITIRIKPYLKDFLVHINGHELPDGSLVVVASKKNITGYYLFPLLEKTPAGWKPMKDDPEKLLTIELPYMADLNIRCNNFLSEVSMRHFQSAIENIFLGEFYREVSYALAHNPKQKIKDAILDFCDAYEISFDNITYEMLRKRYTRYRQETKLKKRDRRAELHIRYRKSLQHQDKNKCNHF